MRPTPVRLVLALLAPAWLVLAMGALAGCGGDDPFDPDKPRRGPEMGLGGQLAPADLPGQGKTKRDKDAAKPPPPPDSDPTVPPPPSPPPPAADSPQPPDPNVQRTPARPGVTGKGEGYGSGPIQTPLREYFMIRERLVFDIQIPQAMKLYRAVNEHYPKSHDEFMKQIIKANSIRLPKLRTAEERYVYLPEKAAKMRGYDTIDPPLVVEGPRR